MSALEQVVTKDAPISAVKNESRESMFSRFLKFLCSVRLGVSLLVLLGLACFVGMLVMQQSVDGFDRYFAELTPAQRLVYGNLGLFDIYHSGYFEALLFLVPLNIVLASMDRFPKTWLFASKPNVTVPIRWLWDQKQNAGIDIAGGPRALAGRGACSM